MFCHKCGTKLDDNAKFCGYCGTPVEQRGISQTAAIPENMVIPEPVVEIEPVVEPEPIMEPEPIVEPETVDKVEPEDNRVDVIDVVWPEHEGKSNERTYRYDPNGENVDKGDTVLVPSVDAFSSKNITRNAKVKRGNYKMDPSKLPHPLKKIICVIKRNS